MPGGAGPALPGPFLGPPTPFRPVDVLGGARGGQSSAALVTPTIRYVRKTGSDSNGGTSPADAWLTIGKALTTAASNTIVYVGAGVYRETIIVTITPTSPVQIVGDVDGSHTGDAGMVQLTAYTTNDKTAPSASATLNLNGKSNLTFKNIMMVAGTGTVITATTATSSNIQFADCEFVGLSTILMQVTCAYGVPLHWAVDRCVFVQMGSNAACFFTLTGSSLVGTTDYDADVVIRNSIFYGGGNQSGTSNALSITGSGTVGRGGGVIVRNCTISGFANMTTVPTANVSTNIPHRVYGCLVYGVGGPVLNATTLGQIVEDYNLFLSQSARSNVAIGAHSVSGSSYAPLFHSGQERIWGGTLRTVGEAMQSSPQRAFGAIDTAAGPLDLRGLPRPSSPSQWDVGALQRGNTAVQETGTTQAGANAVSILGFGSQDFDFPVDAGPVTVSVYVQYDANYSGPAPIVKVTNGTQVGVGDYELIVDPQALGLWKQFTITVNPTAAGVLTLRIVSNDVSGAGHVYADTFAVT